LFNLTDKKGPKTLTLEDLNLVSSECFHCNMCYVNCPYTPPHEFAMDFAHLMDWAWLNYKSKAGLKLRDMLWESMDVLPLVRPLAKGALRAGSKILGVEEDAPMPELSDREPRIENKVEKPIAKVVLFPTCLARNFFPEVVEDLVEVYNKLGIEVKMGNFRCCGAPMLDAGDAKRLHENAEHNVREIEKHRSQGYEVVTPIPTCTMMMTKEYQYVLDREPPKVYDAMEFLFKMKREGKVEIKGDLGGIQILYHTPCHLKHLKVGLPGVQLIRGMNAKVTTADKGCSGIDGGWGLRNYSKAKVVGAKMMEAFASSNAEQFSTECPLAGLQVRKASGRRAMHPISLLKEGMKSVR